jgi:two-component system cell cycle sensor histidine kinase/response regulator CckA
VREQLFTRRGSTEGEPAAADTVADRDYSQQDQKFRALCQGLSDGVFFIGSNGTFSDVNEAACRQHGYTRGELVGLPIERIAARPGFDFALVLEKLRASGGQLRYETANRRKDGSLLPIELSLALIESDGDYVVAGIARDLTEQKQAEATQQRLEEQLHQASKMEAVGRLAGGIAHDFNNLLTVVAGYAELLLHEHDAASSTSLALHEILSAAERASSLTTQLLAFSRKQIIEPRVTDLNRLLEGALRMLERLIGEDVVLLFEGERQLFPVKVDPGQIEQLLINLAVNARDAMPHGGLLRIETHNVRLEESDLSVSPDAQPGSYARLRVQDNGVGMSQDTLEHLFEPFYTTKERGRGSGLGLSIIYGVVRQNGGFITVHSELGQGSRFDIYLPHTAEALPKPAVIEPEPVTAPGRGTVLLVEDEVAVRDVTARFLRNAGYQVVTAGSADEALALVEAKRAASVDVLISDVVLPGMNGRQLYEQLLQRRPLLQVVFISGYNDEVIARHGVVESHILFLEKPFTQEALARKVQEACRRVERMAQHRG